VGLGRWTLSRMEGFFLIIGYSIYLMMVTFSAAR
jgi:hypothetical protein